MKGNQKNTVLSITPTIYNGKKSNLPQKIVGIVDEKKKDEDDEDDESESKNRRVRSSTTQDSDSD
jgi:hypothetical protein